MPTFSQNITNSPSVLVKTCLLKTGVLHDNIVVYGHVIPISKEVKVYSLPYESIVDRIMVVQGQRVNSGDILINVAQSPNTKMELKQAKIEYRAAESNLTNIENKIKAKLTTKTELFSARSRLKQANEKYKSLLSNVVNSKSAIKAESDGIVWQINVNTGELIPAGQMLLSIVPYNKVCVKLGIEPEDIDYVHEGDKVTLARVCSKNTPKIQGKVILVSQQINPITRLVDILILPNKSQKSFLLNDYIAGIISMSSIKNGFIAPRSAILEDEKGFYMFTVKNGFAKIHRVKLGIQEGNYVQVIGPDLSRNMRIVTVGNYELTDGAFVREEKIK